MSGSMIMADAAASLLEEVPVFANCAVREAGVSDMLYITAIYKRFVETSTATFEIAAPSEAEMLKRRATVIEHGLPYLVGELEDYIVGFCYASQFRPREGYRFTVKDSIYVRPACIRHGVGKALLRRPISECKIRGCHSMVAYICGINQPFFEMHSSLDFCQVGLMPEAGYKFGQWLRLLTMQCLLTDE